MFHPWFPKNHFSDIDKDVHQSIPLQAGKTMLAPVDMSFWNEHAMLRYFRIDKVHEDAPAHPIAFPSGYDILKRMAAPGAKLKEMARVADKGSPRIVLCRKTFKVSDHNDSDIPHTINKCMYFCLLEDEDHQPTYRNMLIAACLSFEISKPLPKPLHPEDKVLGSRHSILSMTMDNGVVPIYLPFMLIFNSRDPRNIMSLGAKEWTKIKTLEVSPLEAQRLETRGRPWPLQRSLWSKPMDRFMPLPHMRMYLHLRKNRKDISEAEWELLGHIGDVVSAYAVHMKDGSTDFVLARSRMAQFEVIPEDDQVISDEESAKTSSEDGEEDKDEPHDALEMSERNFPPLEQARIQTKTRNLQFHDLDEDDEGGLLHLGNEFDLGGFSSDLEEDEEEDEEDESKGYSHHAFATSAGQMMMMNSIWSPASTSCVQQPSTSLSSSVWSSSSFHPASTWSAASSWRRPVMRGGD